MATIQGPILPDVVHSTRGILDYAVWRGIPYVRRWPKKPTMPRSPAVQAAGALWADFSQRAQSTSPVLVTGLPTQRWGRLWTWKDAITAAAYGTIWTNRPPQPPTERAEVSANEFKNFPSIEKATGTKPEWWDTSANATLTEISTTTEGITTTYPRALKVVTTANAAYAAQRYTYNDEPRLSANQYALTAIAILTVGGKTARLTFQTSAGFLNASIPTTASSWQIIQIPASLLTGTWLEIRLEVDTGTAYFVPLGLTLGTNPIPLAPRALAYRSIAPINLVTLTGLGNPDAWTDVDITAQAEPLAARAELLIDIQEAVSTFQFFLRTKWSAAARTVLNLYAFTNPAVPIMIVPVQMQLNSSQIFQYLLWRSAGSSTLDQGNIQLTGYWVWA